MRIDLHIHSTASDGVYSPSEVVRLAREHALDVIALTDHDSAEGIRPALAAASEQGSTPEVLAGIELSAEDEEADRHILGYLFDPDDAGLAAFTRHLRESRVRRIEQMVTRLNALGVPLDVGDVLALSKGGAAGRPHVARALLHRGVVTTLEDAFTRYIGDDGPAYVPHHRVSPAEAIALVHRAGGVAVLAHPGRYADYRPLLDGLLPLGLDGLEVYYPDHTPAMTRELRAAARKHGLVISAGSDFHRREGDGATRLGRVQPDDAAGVIAALKERAAQHRQASRASEKTEQSENTE